MLSKTTYQFSVSQNQTIQPPRQIVVIDPTSTIIKYSPLASSPSRTPHPQPRSGRYRANHRIPHQLASRGSKGAGEVWGVWGVWGGKLLTPLPSSPILPPSPISPSPPVQKSPVPLPSLHLISHGSPGIHLGNTTLELNKSGKYRPQTGKNGEVAGDVESGISTKDDASGVD
ncbi:hypothetical protein [[Phormidium] sp. ETS-05]|uniref:hypothetical protein n=1 Tax=[Phormidium] sp. ETS-05 TaxID=222819 RepID=UPI0018EED8AF|nr:hypothetical protein [[Phormidium] sp. ETS-05]